MTIFKRKKNKFQRLRSCSPFETLIRVPQFFFILASSHHHTSMNFFYSFLLLLVVLSAYSEGPQHAKPPDPLDSTVVTVCPNSSSVQLGVLAPVLPQNEVFRIGLPQNGVFRSRTILPQNEVFKIALPQNGVTIIVNYPLSSKVKTVMDYLLNVAVKSFEILPSTLIHAGEKLGWGIRILLECLQHVLKMYTWSLSENQASVQFRCKLIGLLLKQSLFTKHDFAACIYRVYHEHQILGFWHMNFFSKYRKNSHIHVKEDPEKSTRFYFYGGGKALIFSSEELHPYALADLHEQQYQFLRCIKKDDKQILDLDGGNVLCSVPLNVLGPKLTLKSAKEIANLHDMYMPSKILLKNAQLLLENHKCETCPDLLAVFEPYRVASNAERQKTWYEKNIEKRAEYEKHRYPTSGYCESNKNSSKKYYWSKKDVEFPPLPPSTKLCQNIVADFCADTSPGVFEEAGCAVCGKLTPICKMEELAEVENINLLKADGVTRKARCKSSDPVSELRGPILAPDCSQVCPICVESLEKKRV